jgi:DNA polymerase-3 subunit epsilon
MYLYFDTETSGLPAKEGSPLTLQPHIVQLAALLVDETFNEVASFSTLIKPEGWVIDPGAEKVHGISHEKATRYGISVRSAMSTFVQFSRAATIGVAHNIAFDEKLVRYELERFDQPDHLALLKRECTMLASTNVVRIPNLNRGGFKWPKLEEAYSYFFTETLKGSHDALVDVRACARIHKHLIKNNLL